MTITVTKQVEERVDVNVFPYMKTGYTYFKHLGDGYALRVNSHSLYPKTRIEAYEVEQLRECTKAEFDAAYDRAVANIREAYLQ